ncbi:hypothetical protein N0A02_03655 [Paraburkholderia acidicola]|uniref:Protein activator of alkane oxidation PraB n=1 Tax=Paraburkholderia acidicola TaxID=1912599 RepID=A0ABV1LH41_9BURK
MKSLKMRVCSGAVIAMCAAFSAATFAATIGPAGVSFSAPGTIVFSSSFAPNVSCGITLSGVVASDGSYAQINSAAILGGSLCSVPQMTGLPWKLVATSATTFSLANVGFYFIAANCGPGTINGSWNSTTNTLSATNQPIGGSINCTIDRLLLNPSPALNVSP